MQNNDSLRTISLCSGYGGLDLGLHRAFPNARTVCYVENEIPAAAILVENIKKGRLDDAPIWSNLKTFDPRPFVGRIDAIIGGYPCQPFSVAGKRGGTDDPRHLWPYIAELVRVIRPRLCVFENVRGHVRLGLSEVLGDLRSFGYRVRAGIFSAAEVGAPHRRERVFIVGFLEHASRITKREQDDETSTEPRNDSRTMLGGRRSNKVADAESRSRGGSGGRKKTEQSNVVNRSCAEFMAHSIREGLQGHAGDGAGSQESGRVAQGQDGSACAGSVLDDASSERRQQIRRSPFGNEGQNERRFEKNDNIANCASQSHFWPSRPGEPQHEWEEPRTVDRKLNPAWVAQLMGLPSDWVEVEGLTREMKLRALGNGVVPQQAELAIRTLLQ